MRPDSAPDAAVARASRRAAGERAPALIYRLASPNYFYDLTGRALPWLAAATALLFLIGLPWALAFAPRDYQQGDSFRILYIHVPAAAFSMGVYVAMAVTAAIGLIWRIKLAAVISRHCAPVGAAFTFLALVTGSLWGKPMWGTYWVWDARLTSELILLFLYLGYLGLYEAFEERESGSRAAAILALVGVVNIPIIHYSVEWWHTLHQGATVFKLDRPSIAPEMLWPLLVMLAAYGLLAVTAVLARARNEVLERRLET
ncbi:MAG TPA: heme ABC transporter permease [Candidatus Competibacteraceae bacterium]|nr:heme ABC transporter permease [Candidatus Competibacteraceae bacterium]